MKRLVIFFMFLFLVSVVSAVPEIGHQFYGDVTGDCSEIKVSVNDYEETVSVVSNQYGYDTLLFVPVYDAETAGANEGDTVEFYVSDVLVGSETFAKMGITKLDIDCTGIDSSSTNDTNTSDTGSDNNDDTPSDSGSDSSSSSDGDSCDADEDCGEGSVCIVGICEVGVRSSGGCAHDWDCGDWSDCRYDNLQTRECIYIGDCSAEGTYPELSQDCVYQETCSDGLLNQGEEGVDCGGPCSPCYVAPPSEPEETCWDEVQNQGEEGVDCGGPCAECASNAWLWLLLIILLILAVLGGVAYWKKDVIMGWFSSSPKTPPPTPPAFGGQ